MSTASTANILTAEQFLERARRYAAIPRDQRGETVGERQERWDREGVDPVRDREHVETMHGLKRELDRPRRTMRAIATGLQHDRRRLGHAPRQATNARTSGSRRGATRASSRGGDSGDSDGDSDPSGEHAPPAGRETAERPTKPCLDGLGCKGQGVRVKKAVQGPWPKRCDKCKRAREAAKKKRERACGAIDRSTGRVRPHTHPVGKCRRCGTYVREPLSEPKRNLLRTALNPEAAPLREYTAEDTRRPVSTPPPYVPEGRPLRLLANPDYKDIDDRRPDRRLLYAYKVATGELTLQNARAKIASIEKDEEDRERKLARARRAPESEPEQAKDVDLDDLAEAADADAWCEERRAA